MSPESTIDRLLSKLRGGDAGALAAPAILVALLFSAALTRGQIEAVWRTGAFFDSDDAMRAVELRDFLAGRGHTVHGWGLGRNLGPRAGVEEAMLAMLDKLVKIYKGKE